MENQKHLYDTKPIEMKELIFFLEGKKGNKRWKYL